MNLGLISPGPSDGTSFYRSHGPFAYLARETGLHIIEAAEWDWSNLSRCDVVFLQRPFTAAHAMIARTCKAIRVPLWVDYDDLYSQFPPWLLRQQQTYGTAGALLNVQTCLECAEIVTVSTPALVKHTRPDAVVIPNALNNYIWPFSDLPRRKVITWRGSAGHVGDLDPVLPALESVHRDFPDWEFHFLGFPHFKCASLGEVHPYSDLLSYMEQFYSLAPLIHIVPLGDCEFNRCKSNIAWLEATAVGAVTVAPRWPEWEMPGVYCYAPGKFEETLCQAITSPFVWSERQSLSREYVKQFLCLNVVNQRRLEILKRFAP